MSSFGFEFTAVVILFAAALHLCIWQKLANEAIAGDDIQLQLRLCRVLNTDAVQCLERWFYRWRRFSCGALSELDNNNSQ